jgi:uncharacterized glyoxalase superfamily protein PhnB
MHVMLEVCPYLRVDNSAEAIDFYARAFAAKELFRLTKPDERIGHAEVKIGPTTIRLSDEFSEHGIHGPRSHGGTTVQSLKNQRDELCIVLKY